MAVAAAVAATKEKAVSCKRKGMGRRKTHRRLEAIEDRLILLVDAVPSRNMVRREGEVGVVLIGRRRRNERVHGAVRLARKSPSRT